MPNNALILSSFQLSQNTTPLLSPANSSTTSTIFLAVFSGIFQGQNTKKNLGFRLAVKLNITLQEYTIDVLTLKTDHLKECYYYTTNEI